MKNNKIIKNAISTLLAILMIASTCAVAFAEDYELSEQFSSLRTTAFRDDFNGNSIDTTKWNIMRKNWGGNIPGGTEEYNGGVVGENVSVSDGILHLEAHGNYYEGDVLGVKSFRNGNAVRNDGKRVGACIETVDYYASGSYEVRAKVAPVLGACSAIWTFEYEYEYNEATGSEHETNHEIDIEIPGRPDLNVMTGQSFNYALCNTWTGVNTGEYASTGVNTGINSADDQYHTYRFDWHTSGTPRVEFYFDGKLKHTEYKHIPTNASRLVIGVWFPNAWAGSPDFDTSVFEVDYVSINPFNETGDKKQHETSPDYVPHTVSFNGDNATFTAKTVTPGQTYGTADSSGRTWPVATREGSVFDGWYTAAKGGTKVTADTIVPTTSPTLYAHFINPADDPAVVNDTENTTGDTTPIKTDVSGTTVFNVNYSKIRPNLILAPSLVDEGGSEISTYQEKYFSDPALYLGFVHKDAYDVVCDSFTLSGERKASTGTSLTSSEFKAAATTYAASFIYNNTGSAQFASGGGDNGALCLELSKKDSNGKLISISTSPSLRKFIDGSPMSNAYKLITLNASEAASVTHLNLWDYACAAGKNTYTSYQFKLKIEEGTTVTGYSPMRRIYTVGQPYGFLPVVKRNGYNFVGWYTAPQGGTLVTAGSTVSANTILYAHWKKFTTTLRYDLKGGTFGVSHPTYVDYDNVYKISAPTKPGYDFVGWEVSWPEATAGWGETSDIKTAFPIKKVNGVDVATLNVSNPKADIYFKNIVYTDEIKQPKFTALWEVSTHTEHTYVPSVTTAPTCSQPGVMTYTCSCGDSYTEPIAPTGEHEMNDWVIVTAPTSTTDGLIRRNCKHCDYSEEYAITVGGSDSVKSVQISSNQENLLIGNTVTLSAEVLPSTAKNKNVTWSSLNSDVASVENGVVTAKKAGSTVIVVETGDGGYKDFCLIEVAGIVPKLNSTVVVDCDNGIICGIEANLKNLDSFIQVSDEGLSLQYDTTTIGTGTTVNVCKNGEVVDSYKTVIFGDVNGDGIYDGNDAIIVSFLANGMLTETDVGKIVYMAADCNHDGVINQSDVDILSQAGLLIAEVDQTKTAEELATDSVYLEYQSLIDQAPDVSTEKTDTSEENSFISIINIIVEFIKTIISIVKNVISGFSFVK